MNDAAISQSESGGLSEENGTSVEQWRTMYQQMVLECDRLQQELHSVTKERDEYLNAVYAMLPTPELPYTIEELLAQRGAEPTIEQLLEEMQSSEGD